MTRTWLVLLALLVGCHPQPASSSHVDATACLNKCTADGLSMIGMVHTGEYSATCVCEVPRSAGPPPVPAPAGTALTAGVMGSGPTPSATQRSQQQSQQAFTPSGTQSP